jgi:hypothetical protein
MKDLDWRRAKRVHMIVADDAVGGGWTPGMSAYEDVDVAFKKDWLAVATSAETVSVFPAWRVQSVEFPMGDFGDEDD